MRTYTRKDARRCLARWAEEMAGGEGRANPITRFGEGMGGSSEGRPPGGLFSPLAEKVEMSLKDIRAVDARAHALLMALSERQSEDDMVRTAKSDDPEHSRNSKGAIHVDLNGALDMLRISLYLKRA